MDIKDIQNLIKFIAKSGASEVKLEIKDIKITVKTGYGGTYSEVITTPGGVPMQQPLLPQQQLTGSPVVSVPTENQPSGIGDACCKYITIKSPMIGTFYRRSAPDKEPLAELGKTISKGSVICIIEAMKLFNEIESDVSGTIVKILVEDMSPVEFDQPLFLIDPS